MNCIYCKDETGNNSKICDNCKHDLSIEPIPESEPYRPIIDDE
jgi:hypothetical protein